MKTVLVTGAASGIGAHLVKCLERQGHRIIAADVNGDGLRKRSSEDGWNHARVLLQELDVRKERDWEVTLDNTEKSFAPVDTLLNFAGIMLPGYVHELTTESIESQLDVNVKGVIFGTRAVARRMARRRGGHIVNMGSLASLAAAPGLSVYCASKFAVRGFTLAAVEELQPLGIHLSLVMPDAVDTPMLALQENYDEAVLAFSGNRPLTVEEVGHVILEEVLPHRPLELTIPRDRGVLARAVNTVPEFAHFLVPFFTAKGRKTLNKIRKAKAARIVR